MGNVLAGGWCSRLLLLLGENSRPTSNLGRKEFIQFISPGHSPSLNRAGTLAPTQSRTHGGMLLATQWLVLSELSYTAQDHRPRDHTAQSSLGSTTSVNQKALSQMEPQANLI